MNKLIPFKIAVVLGCVSLALVAFAHSNHIISHPIAPTHNVQTHPTKTMPLSDNEIKDEMRSTLGNSMSNVKMKVSHGTIYLAGQLDSLADYEKIITLAESTQGVKDVNVEQLIVKDNPQSLKDLSLTAKVRGTLIREDILDKDIPSWTLNVETKNEQVYLSGQVLSSKQKKSIIRVAKSIKGVQQVHDKMIIVSSHAKKA
ncbi:BON domain-containing protein [Legionella cardiaca]|uniref:BON domain-containing protein n=1 Tax=Legionella cardiaca TaxID=1071983 RepID=A0ABY8APB4_9GAMM|nr:BON domain-containing protein [Legionella cardiaca]WED42482.1 BON domain-containing protein [Legionella cardiaca]